MAEHKLSGDEFFLFIDPAGGVNYDTLVCLINKSWTAGSTPVIDATTQCGPDSLPGIPAPDKVDFDGQNLFDPITGKVSGADLFTLKRDRTTIGWKLAPMAPVDGDEILSGTGFISELSKNYDQGSASVFAGSISVYGQTLQEIYAGS